MGSGRVRRHRCLWNRGVLGALRSLRNSWVLCSLGGLRSSWVCGHRRLRDGRVSRLARGHGLGRVVRRVCDGRSGRWVCGHAGRRDDGLGKSHGNGAGSVDTGGPTLRYVGRAGGLRGALGADGCPVRGGDGSQTSRADIDVGSYQMLANSKWMFGLAINLLVMTVAVVEPVGALGYSEYSGFFVTDGTLS